MDAEAVVIGEVIFQDAMEMPFTEDDDSVRALSADTAIESLGI